ncbi:flagellar filament capping protein FliD [Thermincola ferriacetica]
MERLSGIISGLDTQGLITQLMQIEARPVDLMKQQQHIYELRKELWQEINTSLAALDSKIKDLLDPAKFTVQKTTSQDETVATAAADGTAGAGVYDIFVTTLAKAHRVAGSNQGSATTALGLTGNFTISDGLYTSTISVTADDTLTSIMKKINAAKDNVDSMKDLRVTASIVDNKLVLTHDETGTANSITLTDSNNLGGVTDPTEVLESLGLLKDDKTVANTLQGPVDAVFKINGIDVVRGSNTVSDVVSGLTINLLKEGASATITVEQDTDAVYSTVKAFVDQYNSTMDLINTRLSEEKVKDATTDAALKKGLLRGDSALVGLKDRLRRMVSEPIAGLQPFDRLSDIGITTTSDDFGKSGKLQIDETKLKDAVNQDPEGVARLFFNDLDGDQDIDAGETGIAVKLQNEMEQFISSSTKSIGGVIVKKGLIPARLDSLDKVIKDYDGKIAAYEERLQLREEELWRQFTAMEKALSDMQNQASWLAGQLNALYS